MPVSLFNGIFRDPRRLLVRELGFLCTLLELALLHKGAAALHHELAEEAVIEEHLLRQHNLIGVKTVLPSLAPEDNGRKVRFSKVRKCPGRE